MTAAHFLHFQGALWWRPEPHREAHEHTRTTFERLLPEMAWSPRFTAEITTALRELDAWQAEHIEEIAA